MSQDSLTLDTLWRRATSTYASLPLIISDRDASVFRFEDAGAVVNRLAARLQAVGLSKGDAVCHYGAFHAETMFVFWACANLGLILIPVDPDMPRFQLDQVLDAANPKLLVSDLACSSAVSDIRRIPQIVLDDPAGGPAHAPVFSEWLEPGAESSPAWPDLAPEDPVLILHTSGTTGAPKGIVLSQGALYRSGLLIKETFGWRSGDRLLITAQPHAMSGIRNPGVASLHSGAAFVEPLPETRNNLFLIVQSIQNNRCSLLTTGPTLVNQLCEHYDRIGAEALSSLRTVMCTGSELTSETAARFEKYYGAMVHDYYGLTETCGICIARPVGRQREPGTIGVPVGSSIRIVDDNGRSLEPGEVGELLVSSPNLMNGYFKNQALTDQVLRAGWFYTGDLAMIGKQGGVTLIGRKSDIVKNAQGDLIRPQEVEAILETHPMVTRAGVCGFTSRFGDERLAAFIVVEDRSQAGETLLRELREHVRVHLGKNKVPHLFRVAEKLPTGADGEILRRSLQEALK